jgi:hypothetical protein
MSGVNEIGNALPTNASWDADTARRALARLKVVTTADDVADIDFSELHKDAVPEIIFVRDTLIGYARDPADTTSAHDGVTILVSADNKRFKSDLQPSAFANVLDIVGAPAGTEVAGDRYLVNASPSGAFASFAKKLVYKDGAGDWVAVTPVIGQRVYVRDEETDYQYGEDGSWQESGTIASSAVGAHELAFPWGMVVESETATPPNTRATGATPSMFGGGSATNINDDSDSTSATTSALGDLTAAGVTGRIAFQLDLGAVTALAAIELKGLSNSSGSSSANAEGLYYSSDGLSYTQLGSGFTSSATPTDFVRSGTFNARYVALITEAKNWSTVTKILKGLNVYKQATTAADGTKYIVAANGIGVFSGQDTKVAEAWNGAYRFYTPYAHAQVFDAQQVINRRWTGTAWVSSAGAIIDHTETYTQDTSSTTNNQGDFTNYTYSDSTAPANKLNRADAVTLSYAARKTGTRRLRVKYSARLVGDAGVVYTIGLMRDSGLSAIAWDPVSVPSSGGVARVEFLIDVNDTSSHTYSIRVYYTVGSVITSLSHRLFQIEEFA